MKPPNKPKLTSDRIAELLPLYALGEQVALLGVRGYYANTMGKPGVNDVGIYDDAIFVHSPSLTASYNANTDPSRLRKRVAVLRTGVWLYKLGTHGISKPEAQRYQALVQADYVTVDRWEAGVDSGWFGINIHRGGYNTTSSLGCQTIHPSQWDAFIANVREQLKRYRQKTLYYRLVNGPVV